MIKRSAHRSMFRSGIALVGVLIIIGLLSMISLSLMYRIQAGTTSSATTLSSEQAWAAALSGLDRSINVITDPTRSSQGRINNPTDFEQQLIYDDGIDKWYFSVFRQGNLETGEVVFGVTDEASKLPLNLTNITQLISVPGITLPIAESLADFTDSDSIPRDNGAEQDVYDLLPTPYNIPNQPISFLDELLLANGIHAFHLYGEDLNRNHKLDINENDGDLLLPPDDQDGTLAGGINRYFTLNSRDWNVNRLNQPRININNPDIDLSTLALPEQTILFLEAKRKSNEPITSITDLVDATVTVTEAANIIQDYESGVKEEDLFNLMDLFTTDAREFRPGLVNINTAPANILAQIPGIDENLATTIISTRNSITTEKQSSLAWLIETDIIDIEQFKELEPFLTARSFQFHVQIIGYGLPSGRFRTIEAVVDLIGTTPKIIYLRDLTKLGIPYHFTQQLVSDTTDNE
ncbi:MAG: hypothetical protein VYC62_07655 [Verrucomicrobiota bacterium]|nr:hypothetical protein [Verrucomicrobiota bacterium]